MTEIPWPGWSHYKQDDCYFLDDPPTPMSSYWNNSRCNIYSYVVYPNITEFTKELLGWQPMETAPKDGEEILLWIVPLDKKGFDSVPIIGWYSTLLKDWVFFNDGEEFIRDYDYDVTYRPLCWQPIVGPNE